MQETKHVECVIESAAASKSDGHHGSPTTARGRSWLPHNVLATSGTIQVVTLNFTESRVF